MEVKLVIKENSKGKSIKELLKEYHVGKGKIEEIRVNKLASLNSKKVDIETKLNKDDVLTFNVEETINFKPSINSIDVVYEDEQILIVNKPSGILIHPDGVNSNEDTLVNRVAKYYLDNNLSLEVRYAHRIDEETSGLVIFCKDFLTHSLINYQIEEHIIIREYRAIVQGIFSKKEYVLKFHIGRDRHISNKFRVSDSLKAKQATTNVKVIKSYQNKSLVSCILETGRTHQIRVHLSHINHPLLGDSLYGGNKKDIGRVALHSYRVELVNPITLKKINVTKDMPLDMENVLYGK